MNKEALKIIYFFEAINEYDIRTYLRDCADIFINDKRELEEYYPNEVFNFLKLSRIVHYKKTKKEFLEFIDYITSHSEIAMKTIIAFYIEKADKILNELDNNVRMLRNMKQEREELGL